MRRKKYFAPKNKASQQTLRIGIKQNQKQVKKHQNKYIIDPVLFINPSKRRYQKSARSKEEQTSPLKIDHYKRFVPE